MKHLGSCRFVVLLVCAASAAPALAGFVQLQKMTSSPRGVAAQFGFAVAMNGSTMVTGARFESTTGSQAGAAGVGLVPGDLGLESALTLTKSGGNLTLNWSRTCLSTETDFEVYAGSLGNFASHVPVLCSTVGATAGAERPASASACRPQSIGVCP